MLPKSWDDLFYLLRKEIQEEKELPDFTITQLKKIHTLFWKSIKDEMRKEFKEISLKGFLRILPKKKAYEKSKTIFNSGSSES